MGFPRRPRPTPAQRSSSSSTSQSNAQSRSERASKRLRLAAQEEPLFNREEMKCYLVVAKLTSEELRTLSRSVEDHGGQVVSSYEEATIVLANTRLWGRLSKDIPRYDEEPKRIVHVSWLVDSIAAGHSLPIDEKYLILKPTDVLARVLGERSASPSTPLPGSPARTASPTIRGDTAGLEDDRDSVAGKEIESVEGLPPPNLAHVAPHRNNEIGGPGRATPPKWRNRRFACERWHPLVCVNQSLLLELKWIREWNRLEGEERRSMTYSKAMAAIKSYPYVIKSSQEAHKILAVGEKIAGQCGEFVKHGRIEAAEKIKKDKRFLTMMEFSKVHGVGASTARELYDKHHCRTLADVQAMAHALPAMSENSVRYVEDFDLRIPRAEVEEMAEIVNQELQLIMPGAEYTIVGGYRRGKAESGDVDIVITHPEPDREKGVLSKVLDKLQKSGYVQEILYVAMTDSQRDSTMQHFHASHMDPLDKAFTVWRSPPNGTTRTRFIHRRLDLIIAPRRYYACAVLGWSGSLTFERDLRLHADKVKGMKFDSGGLWKRANSEEVLVYTEEDIFKALGLEYIPPEWRNCDI